MCRQAPGLNAWLMDKHVNKINVPNAKEEKTDDTHIK